MKRIEMVFEEDGSVTIDAIGYTGPGCALDVKVFEDAVGGGARVETRKPEFLRSEETTRRKEAQR